MTSNKQILQTVFALKLEFLGDPLIKHNSYITQFSKEDESTVDLEIKRLSAKGVLTKCEHETGEYISPIFIRQKLDGSCRLKWLMLNLQNLNEDMPYIYFKMETLQSVLSLITPGSYLASLDLKDAFYSVPIHPDYTKFLKFIWKNQLYRFLLLSNDLCCTPRKFMKLPIATLRLDFHIIAIYIDDLINVGLTFGECAENVITSIKHLRFFIQPWALSSNQTNLYSYQNRK